VHNDYSNEVRPKIEIFSDRIEITSAGGLINGMTEEEFFSGYSAPRNKELMRVFKDIHLVEQLGSGMTRILKKYKRSIFIITPNFVRVTFQFTDKVNLQGEGQNGTLNSGLKSLIEVIENNPGIKAKDAAVLLNNRPRDTMSKQLRELLDKGLIERRGSKKSGGYYVLL
jgi:ATP-dependent DNA helicase RecG